MSNERKPMTDEELDAIKGRLAAITEWPWIAFCRTGVRHRMGITNKRLFDDGDAPEVLDVVELGEDTGGIKSEADAAFIAAAPTDIARLLAEVERLREEKEILEGTLDSLGIFVQENLNYCAADFIGEGIDEDAEFTCKTEYDPDNGCQKCYSNCWAEVFRKTAEEEIKALKELEKENAERPQRRRHARASEDCREGSAGAVEI